jgi:hypothetical protein
LTKENKFQSKENLLESVYGSKFGQSLNSKFENPYYEREKNISILQKNNYNILYNPNNRNPQSTDWKSLLNSIKRNKKGPKTMSFKMQNQGEFREKEKSRLDVLFKKLRVGGNRWDSQFKFLD